MRDKLEKIIKAYEELEKKLSDPAVASDIKEFTRLNKEYAHQSDLIAASREYIGALDDIEAAKEMLRDATDADEKEMLQMDISENEEKLPQLEEDIKYMLIPSDPNDDKNTIVEIRSAAGGDEAAIFAGDLYKMYQRFCESRGWKTTVLDSSPSEAGGFKSIEFKVEGDRVYSVMKFESGVHRVQRVPKTESQGRIQTSTATVAVLPEAEEIDVQINQSDPRPPRLPLPCFPRPRRSTSRSTSPTCASTPTAPPALAVSALTPPTPPCASPTCPPTPWCSRRSSAPRSRTARSACRCCAPVCTRWSSRSSRPSLVPSARARSATATVPRRFAPTTSPRTA